MLRVGAKGEAESKCSSRATLPNSCLPAYLLSSEKIAMKSLIVLLAAATFSIQAPAAGSVDGKVIQVRMDKNGWGMVIFDQALGGTPPSCVGAPYANALAFDSNTAGGKAIAAMALTAKATASPITVYGTGACSVYGAYLEDWSYGVIH